MRKYSTKLLLLFSIGLISAVAAQLPIDEDQESVEEPDSVLGPGDPAVVISDRHDLKRDYCKARRFQQKLEVLGCEPRTINHKQCYGRCNSFYVPDEPPKTLILDSYTDVYNLDLTPSSLLNCAMCRPSEAKTVTIKLNCPQMTPNYRMVSIKKIKKCKCNEPSAPLP